MTLALRQVVRHLRSRPPTQPQFNRGRHTATNWAWLSPTTQPRPLASLTALVNNVSPRRHFHVHPVRHEMVQFHLSDIGEGIKEVTVKEWFVQPGDTVAQFDPLCEVQSDKASVTITSRFDGIVRRLHYAIEDVAQTGDPLVEIEVQGEPVGDGGAHVADVPEAEAIHVGQAAPSAATAAAAGGGGGRARALATPAVRRVATEHNIDLTQVRGTGKDGRVLKEDLLLLVERMEASGGSQSMDKLPRSPPAAVPTPVQRPAPQVVSGQVREENFSIFTKAMTKSMTEALKIPHFGYNDEIDMTRLVTLRKELKHMAKEKGIKLSYMPFMVKAASLALKEYPILNCSIDVEREKLLMKSSHNIGVAMDSPHGLIVPNIKNVQDLSVLEVAEDLNRLYDLSMKGKLSKSDLSDGSMTLSNIGSIGGTYAVPVIMPPEVAIVALGKIQVLPRYNYEGNLIKANILKCSWSADHRVLDGATVAKYSNLWKSFLENPSAMILAMK